jgi:hypothetical protein
VTEEVPRAEADQCSTQGEIQAELRIDPQSDGTARVNAHELTNEFPEDLPPVIWPFGFSVRMEGTDIAVLDGDGNEVIEQGQSFLLSGGSVSEDGYHVCLIDGIRY